MNIDAIPLGILFTATIFIVLVAIEAGHKMGHTSRRRSDNEKESPVSAIAAAILGLVAFMLAFTFGMVANRYDARMALVREEANVISTAWLRSDYLPESDRAKAAELFRRYVDIRLTAARSRDFEHKQKYLAETEQIQRQLWDMSVINVRKADTNSASLYADALNQMIDIQALRLAVWTEARIPAGIWLILYALVILGMVAIGYQTAIANSVKRSWATPLLAVAFSLVLFLIISLDRPKSGFIKVSQQPLVDLVVSMDQWGR